MRVGVLVQDGAFDSSVSLTLDLLAAADRLRAAAGRLPLFSVERLGWERRSAITGLGSRLQLDADARRRRPDVLLLPGVNVPTSSEVAAYLARPSAQRLAAWIARQHARGTLVLASCASTFLLAESGILDGQEATAPWFLAPEFRRRYPRVELDDRRTVVWGRGVATAGAAFSQIDLVLSLVRAHGGPRLAQTCMRYLALSAQGAQSRHLIVDHLARASPELLAAERWVRAHLSSAFPVAALAGALHMSPRTLDRRVRAATGQSPLRFVQRLRVETAAHLLESTSLSFDQVSDRVGYGDPAALRRLLRRELGVTARELRRPAAGPLPPAPASQARARSGRVRRRDVPGKLDARAPGGRRSIITDRVRRTVTPPSCTTSTDGARPRLSSDAVTTFAAARERLVTSRPSRSSRLRGDLVASGSRSAIEPVIGARPPGRPATT